MLPFCGNINWKEWLLLYCISWVQSEQQIPGFRYYLQVMLPEIMLPAIKHVYRRTSTRIVPEKVSRRKKNMWMYLYLSHHPAVIYQLMIITCLNPEGSGGDVEVLRSCNHLLYGYTRKNILSSIIIFHIWILYRQSIIWNHTIKSHPVFCIIIAFISILSITH